MMQRYNISADEIFEELQVIADVHSSTLQINATDKFHYIKNIKAFKKDLMLTYGMVPMNDDILNYTLTTLAEQYYTYFEQFDSRFLRTFTVPVRYDGAKTSLDIQKIHEEGIVNHLLNRL